jgi:serine/threonine-protein kinase
VINGRYEIARWLGGGANGVVYAVLDHHQHETSALKFLLNFNRHAPWAEAQLLTRLGGQFILPVRNADHALGLPFVVTEIAVHGSVESQIGIGVEPQLAVRWVRNACQGVARMHDMRLLHNDLKPENLFLSSDQKAMVGDLGLASLWDASGHGHFGGTPATIAPEVATVGVTVPRVDWHLHRPSSV